MQPTGRDLAIVYVLRTLRAFGFGYMSLVLALYLPRHGLSAAAIGAYLSLATLSGIGVNALVLGRVDRLGRRRVLAAAGALWAVSGVLLAVAHGVVPLVAAACLGTLPPGGAGLMSGIEQAIVGGVDPARRARAFGRYGTVGSVAASAGVLAAALPSWLARLGVSAAASERAAMAVYALIGLATVALALSLSRGAETAVNGAGGGQVGRARGAPARRSAFAALGRSRGLVVPLAALFVVDSFGSAMVTVTLLAYWLHARYGLGAGALSLLMFGVRAAATASYPLAVWLGERFGMIRTAVYTHIPSSLLLLALPLVGSAAGAAGLLVARGLLVEMDVPTRQAFLAAAVDPEERAGAAGLTVLGQQFGQLAGPVAGGLALTLAAPALFAVAAGVKIGYDLALWGLCRRYEVGEAPLLRA